jgi:hypothetical protein
VAQRAVLGVLLLAGDPVCSPADLPGALTDARLEARSRGLALGAVGASQACRDAACELGLRSLYLGDEALLPTGVMNLRGNAHRSLRKAVNRVARGGYTAELLRCGALSERMVGQLVAVSDAWLQGTAERGFSMIHDRIDDELLPDALVVSTQVFASHYLRGSLSIIAVTHATGDMPRYLVYVHRSRLEVLQGAFGGVMRRIIERRVRAEAPAALDILRHRLEGGDPPR